MPARRQHQRGNELSRLAHFRHDRESVFARQHDVEYNHIGRSRLRQQVRKRLLPALGNLHLVTFRFEIEA